MAPRRPPPALSGNKKSKRRAREVPKTVNAEEQIDNKSQTTVPSREVRIAEGGKPVRQVKRLRKTTPTNTPMACHLLEIDARSDVDAIKRLISAAGCTHSYPDTAKDPFCLNDEGPDYINAIPSIVPRPKLNEKISDLASWEKEVEKLANEMKKVKKEFDHVLTVAESLDDVQEVAMMAHSKALLQLINRWHAVQAAALIAEEVLGKVLNELEELSKGEISPEKLKKCKLDRQVHWASKTIAAQGDKMMTLCKCKQTVLKALEDNGVKADVDGNAAKHTEERWDTSTSCCAVKDLKPRATAENSHFSSEKKVHANNHVNEKRDCDVPNNEESVDSMSKSPADVLSAGSDVLERLHPSCGILTDKDLCEYWNLLDNNAELEKFICFALVQRIYPNVESLLRNLLFDKAAAAAVDGAQEVGADFMEKSMVTFDIKYALEVLGAPPSQLMSPKSSNVNKLDECAEASIAMLKSDTTSDEEAFSHLMVKCEALCKIFFSEISEQRRVEQEFTVILQSLCSRRARLLELRTSISKEKGIGQGGRILPSSPKESSNSTSC